MQYMVILPNSQDATAYLPQESRPTSDRGELFTARNLLVGFHAEKKVAPQARASGLTVGQLQCKRKLAEVGG